MRRIPKLLASQREGHAVSWMSSLLARQSHQHLEMFSSSSDNLTSHSGSRMTWILTGQASVGCPPYADAVEMSKHRAPPTRNRDPESRERASVHEHCGVKLWATCKFLSQESTQRLENPNNRHPNRLASMCPQHKGQVGSPRQMHLLCDDIQPGPFSLPTGLLWLGGICDHACFLMIVRWQSCKMARRRMKREGC